MTNRTPTQSIAMRNMNDGSISLLSETYGIKVREEIYLDKTIISLYKNKTIFDEKIQREYISNLWEMVIIDYSMPIKWSIGIFYVDVEFQLRLGKEFLDWSFRRDTQYTIKHLVIVSPLKPNDSSIEGWSFFKENKKSREFTYYYDIYSIDKIVFLKT